MLSSAATSTRPLPQPGQLGPQPGQGVDHVGVGLHRGALDLGGVVRRREPRQQLGRAGDELPALQVDQVQLFLGTQGQFGGHPSHPSVAVLRAGIPGTTPPCRAGGALPAAAMITAKTPADSDQPDVQPRLIAGHETARDHAETLESPDQSDDADDGPMLPSTIRWRQVMTAEHPLLPIGNVTAGRKVSVPRR